MKKTFDAKLLNMNYRVTRSVYVCANSVLDLFDVGLYLPLGITFEVTDIEPKWDGAYHTLKWESGIWDNFGDYTFQDMLPPLMHWNPLSSEVIRFLRRQFPQATYIYVSVWVDER